MAPLDNYKMIYRFGYVKLASKFNMVIDNQYSFYDNGYHVELKFGKL